MAKVLKGPISDFKYEEKSLGTLFFEAADKFGDNICQIDGDLGIRESFYDVRKRAIRTAIGLRKLGVSTSDVVVTCSPNNINSAIPVIAALYIGAKVASLDPSLTAKECQYLLNIVHPKVIFVEENSVKIIEEAEILSTKIIVIGQHAKYIGLEEFSEPSEEEDNFFPTPVDNKETAFIFFSSGTTGLPKGICCSHYGIINRTKARISLKCIDSKVMFHYTTLYWISAALALVASYITGGCRILANNPTQEKILTLVETYGVTMAVMAPIYAYQLCNISDFTKFNLKSLKFLNIGGTCINPEQLEFIRKCFKDTEVQLLYGMTEASGALTENDFRGNQRDIYKTKTKSSGKTFVDTEIKIVDVDTREKLGTNKKGEICFKSPFMFNGYYKQDTAGLWDKDGFFSTGDIGYYDEDEYVYVVDRIKEMFKYKSWHIIPTEIEQILMEHPEVKEAVVFGIPHAIDGDHPAACIVLEEKSKISPEEIHLFLNNRVNERKRLRGGIKFVKLIHKTPSGKCQRKQMMNLFLQIH